MHYRTLQVELEEGRVRPLGSEPLSPKGYGLLTLFDSSGPPAVLTCGDLADRWQRLEKLPLDEATDFANDLEQARANLPPLNSSWD